MMIYTSERGLTDVTTNPEVIREWATARGGTPATTQASSGRWKGRRTLCVAFAPEGEPGVRVVDWTEWLDSFERSGLAFMFQDRTVTGGLSRYHELVDRSTVADQL
jgi:hypothetical protein